MIKTTFVICLAALQQILPAIADEFKPIAHEEPSLGRAVEFELDVRPILEANCIACHNVTTSEGELILENIESILKGGASGPAVVPEKPDESLIFKLTRRGEDPVMPPTPNDRQAKEMTPQQLGILRQWIVEGAKAGSVAATKTMNWQPISPKLQGVYSLDVDSTGRFIAAGRGSRVSVYDMIRREVIATLIDPQIKLPGSEEPAGAAHLDFVHAIAFHPTEPMIATSGYRNVKLWRRDAGSIASAIPIPADALVWAANADGKERCLAVASRGIVIVNAESGTERGVIAIDGHAVSALSVFSTEPKWILAATGDARIVVIRGTEMQVAHKSEPLPAAVTALSDELSGGRVAALLADGSVRLLAVAADSGAVTITGELKSDAGPIQKITGHGSSLLTIAADRTVQNWKVEDATQTGRFELPVAVTGLDMDSAIDRAVFVLADGQSMLWSIKESKQIAALTADQTAQRRLKQSEQMKAVRDARVAVLKTQIDEADKELVAQKEAETKAKAEVDKQIPLQADAKTKFDAAVAITAAAKTALEGKTDDEALKKAVTDAEQSETKEKEILQKADSELSIAKKSVEFAVQSIARAEQRVADRKLQHEAATAEATTAAATAEELKPAAALPVTAALASLSIDGRYVFTGDTSGMVRLWNSVDGAAIEVLPGTKVGAAVSLMKPAGAGVILQTADGRLVTRTAFPEWQLAGFLGGAETGGDSVFVDRVLSLAFSPDGTLLAVGGGEASRSGQLTLWNVADGSLLRRFDDAHSDTVYGLEFSADGKLLATAAADKFVKVFDVTSGQFIRSFEGHTHHVMDVSWKADRTSLASAGADNTIKIWNAETGEQSRTISTYTRQVTSLQFVGLQDMIVSSSGDKRVFFHTPSNGNPAREFGGNGDYVYRAVVSTDGTQVISGGEDGTVRVWNGADAAQIITFAP